MREVHTRTPDYTPAPKPRGYLQSFPHVRWGRSRRQEVEGRGAHIRSSYVGLQLLCTVPCMLMSHELFTHSQVLHTGGQVAIQPAPSKNDVALPISAGVGRCEDTLTD
jgi:hypothetical protein